MKRKVIVTVLTAAYVNYLVPYDEGLENRPGILWLAANMVTDETLNQWPVITTGRM